MPLAFQLIKVRGWGCCEEEDGVMEEADEVCARVSLTKGPRLAAGDDEEEEEVGVLTTAKWRFMVVRRVCRIVASPPSKDASGS